MTVTFERGSRRCLKSTRSLRAATALRVLKRIEQSTPHLSFDNWKVCARIADASPGAFDTSETRRRMRVELHAQNRTFRGHCTRGRGRVVPSEDHRFLSHLAKEASHLLDQEGTTDASLVDFGTAAVADTIREEMRINQSPFAVLQFLRGLSQQTYENQRISYGIIISPDAHAPFDAPFTDAVDNKRFKRLSDGYSTAFVLDGGGNLVGLESLPLAENRGSAARRRPSWLGNLAEAANVRNAVGISLTRNGDVLVAANGRLAFAQRAGIWKRWDHSAIIDILKSIGKFRGPPYDFASVLTFLYQVSLDLSFRRSGGLFVILRNRKDYSKLLSDRERVGAVRKPVTDRALDESLGGRKLHRHDRQLVADLSSLDGATVIDRNGNLISYGQVLRVANVGRAGEQGARTRAAKAGSRLGLAIKVSADGDISFYAEGSKRFEI